MKKLNIVMSLLICSLLLGSFAASVIAETKTYKELEAAVGTEETETEYTDETESETEAVPNTYTDDDLYVLSHIIQCEAGYCERAMMEGVGSVVLNRVADPRFPNTIYEVVNQPGQYRPVTDGIFTSAVPTDLVMEVAIDLLEWGSKFPPEVVWQANFPQGSGTYLTLSTSYSTMYFCY